MPKKKLQTKTNFGLIVVGVSGNEKTGPMANTYRKVGHTCPLTCPHMLDEDGNDGACYALQQFFVRMHQNRAEGERHALDNAKRATYTRHHVSGDFYLDDQIDRDYVEYVAGWHRRNPRNFGYTYTHRWRDWDAELRATIPPNLTITASTDDPADAAEARAAGWHTARVVDPYNGEKPPRKIPPESLRYALDVLDPGEYVCPNQAQEALGKEAPVQCIDCRLCIDRAKPGHGVVFIKH